MHVQIVVVRDAGSVGGLPPSEDGPKLEMTSMENNLNSNPSNMQIKVGQRASTETFTGNAESSCRAIKKPGGTYLEYCWDCVWAQIDAHIGC